MFKVYSNTETSILLTRLTMKNRYNNNNTKKVKNPKIIFIPIIQSIK